MIVIRMTYYPAREALDGIGQRLPVGGQFFGGATGRYSPPLIVGPAGHKEELHVDLDFGSDTTELPPVFLFDDVVGPDNSKGKPTWLVVDCEVDRKSQRFALCLDPPDETEGEHLARKRGWLN